MRADTQHVNLALLEGPHLTCHARQAVSYLAKVGLLVADIHLNLRDLHIWLRLKDKVGNFGAVLHLEH